jgi:hypothetical protein
VPTRLPVTAATQQTPKSGRDHQGISKQKYQTDVVVSQHSPVKKRVKENSPPQATDLSTAASRQLHEQGLAAVGSGPKKPGRSHNAIVIQDTPSPHLLASHTHSPRSIITISSDESDGETEVDCSGQWDELNKSSLTALTYKNGGQVDSGFHDAFQAHQINDGRLNVLSFDSNYISVVSQHVLVGVRFSDVFG